MVAGAGVIWHPDGGEDTDGRLRDTCARSIGAVAVAKYAPQWSSRGAAPTYQTSA